MVSVHLDKPLRRTYTTRAMPVRKGDEVKVMRGKYKKKTGKISRVDLKSCKVYIENVKMKKTSGQEVEVPMDPSNLMIIKLETDDKKRLRSLSRKKKAKAIEFK